MNLKKMLIIAVAAVGVPVTAATVTGLVQFSDGDTLSAEAMNGNFDNVKQAVDQNDAAIQSLQSVSGNIIYNMADYQATQVQQKTYSITGMKPREIGQYPTVECERTAAIWNYTAGEGNSFTREQTLGVECQTVTHAFENNSNGLVTFGRTVTFFYAQGVPDQREFNLNHPLLIMKSQMAIGEFVSNDSSGTRTDSNGTDDYVIVYKTTLLEHLDSMAVNGRTFNDCLKLDVQRLANFGGVHSGVVYRCRDVGIVKQTLLEITQISGMWEIQSCTSDGTTEIQNCGF